MGKKKSLNSSALAQSRNVKKETTRNAAGMSSSGADWISALARTSTAQDEPGRHSQSLSSKAERIEKRAAKKRRREERKQHPNSRLHIDKDGDERDTNPTTSSSRPRQSKWNRKSRARLEELSMTFHEFTADSQSTGTRQSFVSSDSVKKGKATSGNQLNDRRIQPRPRDYGGLGLARPSLLIALRDPSFVPKLEEEFSEHVPGFFGKQRTKAMKRQLDGNMLWRQLAEKRAADQRVGGKKLSDMAPDERVEAMLKSGMI